MTSYRNPDYVEHASLRYTIFKSVVYFILNRDKAKASENQNTTFENTLASLVLKRLQVHFILTGNHRLKIVEMELMGVKLLHVLSSLAYTVLLL